MVVTKYNRQKTRYVIEYSRTVNRYTNLDAHPLPNIDKAVDKIAQYQVFIYFVLLFFIHVYPPLTRKRIVSQYFGRNVRTRLGVATSEVFGSPVFHIKVGASN